VTVAVAVDPVRCSIDVLTPDTGFVACYTATANVSHLSLRPSSRLSSVTARYCFHHIRKILLVVQQNKSSENR
jgi:hypothetical protein